MKVVDKINQKLKEGKTFFSFEFFPPRTEEGVENLFERLDRMVAYGPVFCDITWGAGGTTADVTLDIATRMQNQICVETMMHLTCTNMPEVKLEAALKEVKKAGVQNILALRGDPPKDQEKFEQVEGGFACALDLVKYIRKQHGDYFGITVAGYPEAHPDIIVDDPVQMEKNLQASIAYLKEKVEAGGEVIITQLFYDVDLFLKFVADCRAAGITAPILPGIMPIMTYGGFKRMTGFCKTKVPQEMADKLEEIKDNEEAVKNYGMEIGVQLCRRLLDAGVPGLHMYTLNLEKSALGILERIGLIDTSRVPRPLPWRHVPAGTSRAVEAVRPVFWSNRPKAYVKRTQDWDSYSTGRWANPSSAAYASLQEHPFMRRHTSNDARKDKARAAWGAELKGEDDVKAVFAKYVAGEIAVFPWSELEDGLLPESSPIKEQLAKLNAAGYLTINSQPPVNGAKSTDAVHGWGGPGGYVYQKAYAEFFCSPAAFAALQTRLAAAPSVSYIATTAAGGAVQGNMAADDVNALTWGVFPGKEVVQPTVVCASAFSVWKDEAFGLWLSEWGNLYEEGSASRDLLKSIATSWYLVSVVENDYVSGDLFKALLA